MENRDKPVKPVGKVLQESRVKTLFGTSSWHKFPWSCVHNSVFTVTFLLLVLELWNYHSSILFDPQSLYIALVCLSFGLDILALFW